MAPRNNKRTILNIILIAGSIWGLSEFILGMGLQKCTAVFSGAIMTGMAFLWISITYTVTRKWLPLVAILGIVCLFKLMDALLLPVAISHGSILNPIFAFFTITIGFIGVLLLTGKHFETSLRTRILTGAGAALIAVFLFPLAGFVTGSPACVKGATSIPLSIYTSPVAVMLSMITVPVGYFLGKKYEEFVGQKKINLPLFFRYTGSALFLAGSIVLVVLLRIF